MGGHGREGERDGAEEIGGKDIKRPPVFADGRGGRGAPRGELRAYHEIRREERRTAENTVAAMVERKGAPCVVNVMAAVF